MPIIETFAFITRDDKSRRLLAVRTFSEREFTFAAKTHKLYTARSRRSLFPLFARGSPPAAAYYNVTVTFYAARNSDTQERGIARLRHGERGITIIGFQPRASCRACVHLGANKHYYPPLSLAYTRLLARDVCAAVCARTTIGNGYGLIRARAYLCESPETSREDGPLRSSKPFRNIVKLSE